MKEYRAKNLERLREQEKQYRTKLKDDPEYKIKNRERTRQWAEQNPEKYRERIREASYKKKYGISIAEYDSKLQEQAEVCKICGEADNKRLAVDHCHTSGQVRGLLCWRCNVVLGKIEDSPQLLTKMIDYLEEYNEIEASIGESQRPKSPEEST